MYHEPLLGGFFGIISFNPNDNSVSCHFCPHIPGKRTEAHSSENLPKTSGLAKSDPTLSFSHLVSQALTISQSFILLYKKVYFKTMDHQASPTLDIHSRVKVHLDDNQNSMVWAGGIYKEKEGKRKMISERIFNSQNELPVLF